MTRVLCKGTRLRAKFLDAVTIIRTPDSVEYRARSETGDGFYRVRTAGDEWSCQCQAFSESGTTCKHVAAVQIGLDRSLSKGPVRGSRPTFAQNWPAYDAAQQDEHPLFDPLLWSLLDDVPEPPRLPGKRGRNPVPLRTQLLLSVKKVYLGESARRARGHIRTEYRGGQGLLQSIPNYAVPSRFFNRQDAAPLLLDLITGSAHPLRDIEAGGVVAVDSSGFCTTCMGAYCSEMYNPTRKHRFVKAHIIIGVKTHNVIGVQLTEEVGADTTQFIPLLRGAKEAGFTPAAVVADGAYPSRQNFGRPRNSG